MKRIFIAIGYGILAALATYLVGLLLKSASLEAGNFVMAISALIGVIAGGWYLLAGRRPL